MNQQEKIDQGLRRLRAVTANGKWTVQETSNWQGAYSLPELLRHYFASPGPVGVAIEGTANPTFLHSLEEVQVWARQKSMNAVFHMSVLNRFSPIIFAEGDCDNIFWCDASDPECPVFVSDAVGWPGSNDISEGIHEFEQVSGGLGDFLLALASLTEAIGGDSVAFCYRYCDDNFDPTEECRQTFLPIFSDALESEAFGKRFFGLFIGWPAD